MYIPLYNKSNYTLLSSLIKIDDLITYASKNNISSIALTDTTMYGTMEFINKCKSKNIKPIIGLDIILDEYNIVLLAKDYDGYKSLIKLSTIQNEAKVIEDNLKQYNKGLIAIIPYEHKDKYLSLEKIYSNIYLGYTNKSQEQEVRLLTENIVFFRESLYIDEEDSSLLTYVYLIRDGKTISDETNYKVTNHELLIENLSSLTDEIGLNNTIKISDMCNLEFPKPKLLLPIYKCEDPKK